MLKSVLISALLSLAVATPVPQPADLEVRQLLGSSNDVEQGNCKDTMFIFARGSTEIGNMVRWTCQLLLLRNESKS